MARRTKIWIRSRVKFIWRVARENLSFKMGSVSIGVYFNIGDIVRALWGVVGAGRMEAMCLGVPSKVIAIKGQKAKVKQQDHYHWVDVSLLGDVSVGDYVLTYQNVAINLLSLAEAKESLALVEEL